jgi:N-acetylglutamate synthase-like GNAT family acetyltransferase
MPLVTRPARPDDAAEIRAMVRAAYTRWVPIIGREPRPMQADYALAVGKHRFDLVDADGRIVALLESVARADHYWVENIAVLPELQGQGLGRQLLALADHLARAAGLAELRLLTNGRMAANRRL